MESYGAFWAVVAVVLVAGEIAASGFYLAPFAVAAAVTSAAAFAGAPFVVQLLVFLISGTISFAALRPIGRRLNQLPQAAIGATRLSGAAGVVLEEIESAGEGLVRVDREEWRAEAVDHSPLAPGERVRVVEVRGTRLVVEKETST